MPSEFSVTTEQCVENRRYQNWLVKHHLMFRQVGFNSYEKTKLKFKPGKKITSYQRNVLDYLSQESGYIVSREKVARIIHNGHDSPTELRTAQNLLAFVRRNLIDYRQILNVVNVGWAMGIDRILLPESKLRLCYIFWQDGQGNQQESTDFLDLDYISWRLYGVKNNPKSTQLIRSGIQELREILEKNNAPVQIETQKYQGYRFIT